MQQAAVSHALPVQRQIVQNTRFQQQPSFRALPANVKSLRYAPYPTQTNFNPKHFPRQPQTLAQAPQKQTLFQRSVQNQVGNFQGNFNPFQQPAQQFHDFGQNRPVAAALTQQPPLVQQNQPFVQNGNTVRFPNNQQQQVFGQKNQFHAQTQSDGFQPNNGHFQQQQQQQKQQPNNQFQVVFFTWPFKFNLKNNFNFSNKT